MDKRKFYFYICKPFCKYFKPNEKEDMACQGAKVIERLIYLGRINPEILPKSGKKPHLWKTKDNNLYLYVCSLCPFKEDGCDYQAPQPVPNAEPCGGYILLRLLKVKDFISIRDLEEISYGE